MNIIIPLGGMGSRFSRERYARPKPFVRIMGKEMIVWLLESLTIQEGDSLMIIYDPGHENMKELMGTVRNVFPRCSLIELPGPTRGAAETVLCGLRALDFDDLKKPCMLLDGDAFYSVDVVSMYRGLSAGHNATFCFEDSQKDPIYSYVKIAGTSCDVVDIAEKVKISDYANSGCYCFRSGAELKSYCSSVIDRNITQLSQDNHGEFYTSGVIKEMCNDGISCRMILLKKSDINVLGTPMHVKSFCGNPAFARRMRVCFAFEGVLCTYKSGAIEKVDGEIELLGLMKSDISKWQPISKGTDLVQILLEQGNYISITTSMPNSFSEKVSQWLIQNGIADVHVYYSAPSADLNISNKCVNIHESVDLQKDVGCYGSSPRRFLRRSESVLKSSFSSSKAMLSPKAEMVISVSIGAILMYLFQRMHST